MSEENKGKDPEPEKNTNDKVAGIFGKITEFFDQKSEEFHNGEMRVKIESLTEQAREQANDLIERAKESGLKIGEAIDEKIAEFKGKKGGTGNQNGEGI